jgi:hypothetical protein
VADGIGKASVESLCVQGYLDVSTQTPHFCPPHVIKLLPRTLITRGGVGSGIVNLIDHLLKLIGVLIEFDSPVPPTLTEDQIVKLLEPFPPTATPF